MGSNSCARCLGWTNSPKDVLALLNNEWNACASCAHKKVIGTVAEQLRLRQPRWWVVNGRVVVPIWIVERLGVSPAPSAPPVNVT